MRESFVFYRSFWESLSSLEDSVRVRLFDAICKYSLDGTEPDLHGFERSIFCLIRPQIDANVTRYNNGRKGGRPKKEKTEPKPKHNQNETKVEPNDNVNDNVNGNVNDKLEPPTEGVREPRINHFDRTRIDSKIPNQWLEDCQKEMSWPANVALDVWTKFWGHYSRKIGHAALKTQEEWGAEWRTWYRGTNIKSMAKPKVETKTNVRTL